MAIGVCAVIADVLLTAVQPRTADAYHHLCARCRFTRSLMCSYVISVVD